MLVGGEEKQADIQIEEENARKRHGRVPWCYIVSNVRRLVAAKASALRHAQVHVELVPMPSSCFQHHAISSFVSLTQQQNLEEPQRSQEEFGSELILTGQVGNSYESNIIKVNPTALCFRVSQRSDMD